MFGSLDGTDNGRQRTSKLWLGCNPDVLQSNPEQGIFFLDDFLSFTTTAAGVLDGRKVVQATAGTVVEVDDEEYGVCAMSSSTTINQGTALFYPGITIAPSGDKTIGFEIRCKTEAITSGVQFYAGLALATIDVSPVTAGAIEGTVTDHIGFYTTSDAVVDFACEDGGTAVVGKAGAHTFVTGEYVKLGFRVNGETSVDTYVNGVQVANTQTAASIPEDTVLRPAIANLSPGTGSPVTSVDWVAIGVWGA